MAKRPMAVYWAAVIGAIILAWTIGVLVFAFRFLEATGLGLVDVRFALTIIYVAVLALFIIGALLYSLSRAYNVKDDSIEIVRKVVGEAEGQGASGLSKSERLALIRIIAAPPVKMVGYARGLLALSVIFVLGIALFSAMTVEMPTASKEVVNTILGALIGVVAAITGFYFGQSGTMEAKAPKEEEPRGVEVEIKSPSSGTEFLLAKNQSVVDVMVKGSASSNVELEKVEVRLGTGDWSEAEGLKSWRKTLSLAEGTHKINARATDSTGRSDLDTVTVEVIRPGSPSITINKPTADETIASEELEQPVEGAAKTAHKGVTISKIQVSRDHQEWHEVEPDKKWKGTLKLMAEDGTIYARITDSLKRTKEDKVEFRRKAVEDASGEAEGGETKDP